MSFFVTVFMTIIAVMLCSVDSFQASRWNVLNLQSGSDSVSLSFMSLLVFAIYMHRFSQWADDTLKPAGYPPRPVKNFTTWLQFIFWGAVYGLIGCSIMLMIYKYPTLLSPLKGQVIVGPFVDALLPKDSQNLSPLALGVAVSLGFLTLPKLEPMFRRQLQQAALIPSRATHVVNSLISDFDSFKPDEEHIQHFLKATDSDPAAPKIYGAELSVPDDQHYLEVYPRLEYLLWRIEELKQRPGFERAIAPHSAELESIRSELDRIRHGIINVAATVALLADDMELGAEDIHRKAGIERAGNHPLAITVLDDILRAAKDKDGASIVEQKLMESIDTELRYLRTCCDQLLSRVIKACVLAAFTADTRSPESWLERIGLAYSGDVVDKPDSDTLVMSMIVAVTAAAGVIFCLGVLGLLTSYVVPTIISASMQASGLIGGYFIGSLALNERNQSAIDPKDVKFGAWNFLKILAGSWASVVFALFACSIVLGKGYAPGFTLFQTSVKYAHISALLGPAIACSCFRISRGESPFTWFHILGLVTAAFLSTVVAVWLHFGEEFYREEKAMGYIGFSIVIPAIVGLSLRYPFWRISPEAWAKLKGEDKALNPEGPPA